LNSGQCGGAGSGNEGGRLSPRRIVAGLKAGEPDACRMSFGNFTKKRRSMNRRIASRWILMAAVVLTLVPLGRAQAQIVGDWEGIASVQGTDYHIIVHITPASDVTYAATLDSPELGVTGVAMTGVTFKDSKFSMNVDAYHGVYTGTLSSDGTRITGIFAGDQDTPIEFTRVAATAAPKAATPAAPEAAVPTQTAAPKPATPSDIDGTWAGAVDVNGKTLHVLLKVTNTVDGLTAQLQSPDQSPVWLSANTVTRANGTLTASFTALQAEFSGKIAADLGSIDGTFSQAGGNMPLVLKRQQ
jgi:hypothetical protein